jgi:hypothetical protein
VGGVVAGDRQQRGRDALHALEAQAPARGVRGNAVGLRARGAWQRRQARRGEGISMIFRS